MEWLQQGCEWRFGSRFFSTLALMIFLLKFPVKNALKSSFFSASASRSGFGAAISAAIMYVEASLCKSWLCVKAGPM